MSLLEDEDEFTALSSANTPRADLVKAPANGVDEWLVMKQDADGLLDPEFVRDLIGKQAEPAGSGREQVVMPSGVTLSGSAADIAAFIHKAALKAEAGDVAKAKNDTADREHKAATGAAMPDGSYPIASEEDLRKAIHAVGRGGSSHDAIRKHIISRARSLGKSSMIPDNWNSDGSLKSGVSKADLGVDMADLELDDGIDGMDPTVTLAAPEDDCPGDPTDPGSPAWEAIDAATAQKWLAISARLKNALCVLSERELLEAAAADPDDAENAWDLQDAQCAMDFVISVLAVFAAGEQAEADLGGEAMAAIGKALASFDPAPLEAVEGLAAVAKAGRVLSAANEGLIRQAAADLQTVLSSLPKAPTAEDGQPVAKEGTPVEGTQTAPDAGQDAARVEKEAAPSPEAQAAASGPVNAGGTTGLGQPRETGPDSAKPADGPQAVLPGDVPGRTVIKAAAAVGLFSHGRQFLGLADPAAILTDIAKADDGKKAMCVVYNQAGKLMGIVDPDDITPVANSEAEPGEAPDGDSSDAAPAPDEGDMTPAPPAETGTPADAVEDDGTVAKSNDEPDAYQVLKSIVAEAVSSALGAQAPQEDIAKQADVAGLSQKVEELLGRVAKVEEMPAAPKVFTNGQVPPREQMRGQDHGASPVIPVAKAREMKQRMYTADPAEANRIATEMNKSAIAALEAIHAGARQ